MKYNEIEKCVAFNTEEIIFMPNEIFEELKNNISNTQQLTFAYSYLYLITYLYRHCKYYNVGDIDGNKIKEILGYSSNTRSINPIIKKGGLLDQMELTSTEKDFPTEWHFDSFSGDLVFDMLSEFDEDYQVIIKEGLSRKFTVKKPIRSFHLTLMMLKQRKCMMSKSMKMVHSLNLKILIKFLLKCSCSAWIMTKLDVQDSIYTVT
jgi:hypothetical protein